MEILDEPHAARILLLLRAKGALRFTQIQETLGLNPNQVDRALKSLTRELHVVPETLPPGAGRILVAYFTTRKGEAVARLLDRIREEAHQNQRLLGAKLVREIDGLYSSA